MRPSLTMTKVPSKLGSQVTVPGRAPALLVMITRELTEQLAYSANRSRAARTRRWEAMVAYLKKHRGATLEAVIANTPYTRANYRLDLARGAIKA